MLPTAVTTVLAGLFMIGFLVVLHEFGHFVFAKLFGVGVPVFSVGMGPRLFGVVYKGTDYRLSLLPVGGYVQMAGADMYGEEDASLHVDPDEDFMRKPVWQRVIVMAAGPGVNLILPFVLFTILLLLGRPDLAAHVGLVLPDTPAAEAGFQTDDVVVSVDGEPVEIWHDVTSRLAERVGAEAAVPLMVRRGDETLTLTLPPSALSLAPSGILDENALGLQPFYATTRVGVQDPASAAFEDGLRTGDVITAVDGTEVSTWDDLLTRLDGADTHELAVRRPPTTAAAEAGEPRPEAEELTLTLSLEDDDAPVEGLYGNRWGVLPVMLFANQVSEDSPAARAGLQAGDRFLAVDGQPIRSFDHFIDLVAQTLPADATSPRPLELVVVRDGARASMTLTPEVRVVQGEAYSRPLIGVMSFGGIKQVTSIAQKYYSLGEAVPRAADESIDVIARTASMLGNLFTGRVDPRDSVGGPIAIVQTAGAFAEQGFFQYAMLIGMISVSLGVINLLPVPVLDGGQILFYLVELVRGRPLSLELRERFQMVGVIALVILMLLVTVNDIHRWVTG